MECLSQIELAKLLDVDLRQNPDLQTQLDHLDSCEACVTRLEELSVSTFPAINRSDAIGSASAPVDFVEKLQPLNDRLAGRKKDSSGIGNEFRNRDVGQCLRKIGHYSLLEKVGDGGMGSVYRALDEKLNRIVAVKLLSDKFGDATESLISHEALAAAQVEHKNVIPVFSIETHDKETLLAMQFLDGQTLAHRISECEMSARDSVIAIAAVAEGLSAAHEQGVIHRDIKPANILFDSKEGTAKIGDFGLAVARGNVDSKVQGGTPGYMSPELNGGGIPSRRTDVYALGVTLHQALVRKMSFELSENESLSADLQAIVAKATADDTQWRYGTMQEFAADLDRWLRGEAISARQEAWLDSAGRNWRRHKTKWLSAGVIAIVLLGSFSIWNGQSKKIARLVTSTEQTKATARKEITNMFVANSPETFEGDESSLLDLISRGAEVKTARLADSTDLARIVEVQVRSGHDFYRNKRYLDSLTSFEKAIDAAISMGASQLEPMQSFRLLRGCRLAIEMNLDSQRLDEAESRINDFRELASQLSFDNDEFSNRIELHGLFVSIYESKLKCKRGQEESAADVLLAMEGQVSRISEFDFSSSFRSNSHQIELNTKWASARVSAGDSTKAIEFFRGCADKYPRASSDDWFDQGRAIYSNWNRATRRFMEAKQFELAQISNNKVIEILDLWPAPDSLQRLIKEEVAKAADRADTLDALVSP